jgi:glycosyltransferase involved in cell wall biosynthesis
MRILLISFYFPPAGGGGVQRTLKFCRYLPEFGVDVDVLAPTDSKWFDRDEPLMAEIPATTRVHRVAFHGPRSASRADDLFGAHGIERVKVEARHIYGRLLVPDKATPWFATAVPRARSIVRSENIEAIVTTSPPNSVHLIGAAVARLTGVPWVADFRDPWVTNIHKRYDNRAVRAKQAAIRRMARLVARRADRLVAVTEEIAEELATLDPSAAAKTTVIENGSDFADFEALRYRPSERFVLVHAGSFFGERSPRPTLEGLRALLARRPELRGRVLVRFVGTMRAEDEAWAHGLGIDDAWEAAGFRPYAESVASQREADALLLLIEHAGGRGDRVPCGKLWEYLAARRPILATVPEHGVAADMIRELDAGVITDPEDTDAISRALEQLVDRWSNGGLPDNSYPESLPDRISRRSRARELADVLDDVTA